MDPNQMIVVCITIACVIAVIILSYVFKNQILTAINSTFIANSSDNSKMASNDILRDIEMKIHRRAKR